MLFYDTSADVPEPDSDYNEDDDDSYEEDDDDDEDEGETRLSADEVEKILDGPMRNKSEPE